MNLKDIQSLIRMITKANLSEFKMKTKDVDISIRTDLYQKSGGDTTVIAAPSQMSAPASAPVPSPSAAASASNTPASEQEAAPVNDSSDGLLEIRSPIVGTFYRSSSPDKPPYAKVGDSISEGDTVCIVEAMKLFNEIESEVSGTVVKVMLEDASPVEYDQVLFLVDPAG